MVPELLLSRDREEAVGLDFSGSGLRHLSRSFAHEPLQMRPERALGRLFSVSAVAEIAGQRLAAAQPNG